MLNKKSCSVFVAVNQQDSDSIKWGQLFCTDIKFATYALNNISSIPLQLLDCSLVVRKSV